MYCTNPEAWIRQNAHASNSRLSSCLLNAALTIPGVNFRVIVDNVLDMSYSYCGVIAYNIAVLDCPAHFHEQLRGLMEDGAHTFLRYARAWSSSDGPRLPQVDFNDRTSVCSVSLRATEGDEACFTLKINATRADSIDSLQESRLNHLNIAHGLVFKNHHLPVCPINIQHIVYEITRDLVLLNTTGVIEVNRVRQFNTVGPRSLMFSFVKDTDTPSLHVSAGGPFFGDLPLGQSLLRVLSYKDIGARFSRIADEWEFIFDLPVHDVDQQLLWSGSMAHYGYDATLLFPNFLFQSTPETDVIQEEDDRAVDEEQMRAELLAEAQKVKSTAITACGAIALAMSNGYSADSSVDVLGYGIEISGESDEIVDLTVTLTFDSPACEERNRVLQALCTECEESLSRYLSDALTTVLYGDTSGPQSHQATIHVAVARCVPTHDAKLAEALTQTLTAEEHKLLHEAVFHRLSPSPFCWGGSLQERQAMFRLGKAIIPGAELPHVPGMDQ